MQPLQANVSIAEIPTYSDLLFVDNAPKEKKKRPAEDLENSCMGVLIEISAAKFVW